MQRYDIVVFDRVAPPQLSSGNYLLIDTAPRGSEFDVRQRLKTTMVDGIGNTSLTQGLNLNQLRINNARQFQVDRDSGMQRLFWAPDTDLAVRSLQPGRRLIYLGFDLLESGFPRQTAFPLFIRRSVEWLASAGFEDPGLQYRERSRQVVAGDSFTLELAPGTEEMLIATPDGSAQAVVLESPRYTFTDTSKTGLYQYSIAGVRHYVAANLTDAAESNINQRVSVAASRTPPTASTLAGITRKSLWPQLVWLALALLIAEWCLWCIRRDYA